MSYGDIKTSVPATDYIFYMILLPPDGPAPYPHSPSYLQHVQGPSPHPPASSPNAVIAPEDDVQRLFNVCKVGQGNAELLQEVLVYAKPQELKNDITKVPSYFRLPICCRRPTDGRRNCWIERGHPMSSLGLKFHGRRPRRRSRGEQRGQRRRPLKNTCSPPSWLLTSS